MKLSEKESLSGSQSGGVLIKTIVKKPAILAMTTSSMDAKSEQRFVAKLKEADFDTTLLLLPTNLFINPR